eukprot:TRINITY_DN11485_c0_g1_i1.p2 TRINITY_DN11485_c0_g1~~TRINITY_DN11485_c0_g1_i1.p2  ORF type:complete len:200 (+),score=31.94 TRINITY_DN11485_c0_g1_i1:124-723(+)
MAPAVASAAAASGVAQPSPRPGSSALNAAGMALAGTDTSSTPRGVVTERCAPRWVGLQPPGAPPPVKTFRLGEAPPVRLPRMPGSPRADCLVCPGSGMLRELQTPRKVKALDAVLAKVNEDRRRTSQSTSGLASGLLSMLDTIDEAKFVASNSSRGCRTLEVTSPMSLDGDGAGTEGSEKAVAREVLEDLLLSAISRQA